jgi:mono/diheme cytochrome c family protein
MGVFVVNTGAPQNTSWPTVQGGFVNEPQGPPYYTTDASGNPNGACSTKAILKDLGAKFYPDPSQLLTGAFLHGLQSFAAVNLSESDPAFAADANQALRDAVLAASGAYRKAVDPRGLRTTLSCFKVANGLPLKAGDPACAAVAGFTPPAALPETKAAYANTVDLGFGREMHCVQSGARSACYVSNYVSQVYTGPGQGSDVSKANAAVDGLNGLLAADATVAMEFSAIEDFAAPGAPVTITDTLATVKFFVFNGAGQPVDQANLDGLGSRPVPQLCMVCHGGAIPNANGSTQTSNGVKTPVFRDPAVDAAGSRADARLGSRFLPFDLRSFSYSTQAGFDRGTQEPAFKALNEIAKASPPPDAADPSSFVISTLFDTWYPGNVTPQKHLAPTLWSSNAQRSTAYLNVVAPACRTCHVANASPNLRFDRAVSSGGVDGFNAALAAVQLRVCKQHVMPHARRTHDLFWTSTAPNQGAQLQVYGDAAKAADPSLGWGVVGSSGVSLDLLCGNEYTQGGGVIVTNTAFSAVSLIFSGNCTGCHSDGAANSTSKAKLGLNTDAYTHIVGVNAFELPAMKRVAPSQPNNSYLLRKMLNTHTGLGSYTAPGPGVQMPQGGPFNVTDQNTVSGWISGGAQP